jgi:2-oxoglutarate ferredoxin oxidoreductase subunit gamma
VVEKAIIAGFGGQGILFFGKVLAQAGMDEGHHVTYFPSYGPEVRGGRANCHITVSSQEIYLPMVAQADAVLAMSQPAWDFFAARLKPDGLAVLNASMVTVGEHTQATQRIVAVPATAIAVDVGDIRATNMVMLGAYNHIRALLPLEALLHSLRTTLTTRKAELYDLNQRAIHRGIDAVEGRPGSSG